MPLYYRAFHVCHYCWFHFFFFKQKTAYEMRISDWSSDVCSSDLGSRARCDWCGGCRLELKFATIQSRHPELVSGSIVPQTMRPNGEEWMLKQVQHDGHDTTNFSSTIQGSFPADAKGGIHAEARRSRRRSRELFRRSRKKR